MCDSLQLWSQRSLLRGAFIFLTGQRYQDELGVLGFVHAFEQATGFWKQAPSIAL
jgi:hypothetical protein